MIWHLAVPFAPTMRLVWESRREETIYSAAPIRNDARRRVKKGMTTLGYFALQVRLRDYASAHSIDTAAGVMFSICPSVCACVHSPAGLPRFLVSSIRCFCFAWVRTEGAWLV